MSEEFCFHCGLPVGSGSEFTVEIQGHPRIMCCAGCQAVAKTIVDIGMDSFYDHRLKSAPGTLPAADIVPQFIADLSNWDETSLQTPYITQSDQQNQEITLIIAGITCAACAWLIEQQLKKQAGIIECKINSSSHHALVTWNPEQIKLSQILQAIAAVGYKAEPYTPIRAEAQIKQDNKTALIRIGLAGLGTMQVMMYAVGLYLGAFEGMEQNYQSFLRWVSALVATPVYFYSGFPFLKAAQISLRNRHLTMDVSVAIAISFAYFASLWATLTNGPEVYFDSVCMFIFFLSVGRYLEMRARHHAQSSTIKLTHNQQLIARVVISDLQTQMIPANKLIVGQTILVKAGETIAGDGIVSAGESTVNEAMLTGEELPILKRINDAVTGGTFNIDQPLTITITKNPQESALATIKQLLARAEAIKPPTYVLADKIARQFVLAILVIASLVYLYWHFNSPADAFWITLSVLVVTCPCALSLATPTAITAATSALANIGFLSTRAHTIEALRSVDHVVFDKTGTLTNGNYELIQVCPLNNWSEIQVLAIASALEAYSEHPIAKAFHGESLPSALENVKVQPNLGVKGQWRGFNVRIGKPAFADPQNQVTPPEQSGGQWILLTVNSEPVAWFEVVDQLRQDAAETITILQQQGKTCHILSGDSSGHAYTVGKKLGIENIRHNAAPADKLSYIHDLQKNGARVLMVGDGINDGPVLAGADVSIAVANASDLAKIAADGVLLGTSLKPLIGVMKGANATYRIISQNLSWAILYNLIALPLAACGFIPPWASALGMSASSLLVVFNALRVKRIVGQTRWT